MGPRKRDNKVVNNDIKQNQQKKGKKKISTNNLPLIRIEIPSKTDTKNSKSRVVTAQPLTPQMLLTKKNNTNNVRSAKPFLRSSTALQNKANVENMDSKCEPTVQSSEAEVTPQKASTTDAAPAKPAVKRKQTPKRQLNKTSKMNTSQAAYVTDEDSDDIILDKASRPKIRKIKEWKENSVTQETNAATRANNRLTQRRLTRSNILTSKRGGMSRRKSIVNDQKGKNVKETNGRKILLESSSSLSKNKLTNVKITFNGLKSAEESRNSPVSSECLSWTRDISTSSTTTCFTVHTDDFVRFDEKLPIVKLTEADQIFNVESVINNKSNDDEISKKLSNNDSNVSHATTRSLSLSSTSESDSDMDVASERSDDNDKNQDPFSKILNKLTATLKNFDIEIMNWIGYDSKDNDDATERVTEKFYSAFKEESQVITNCRNIKKVLLGDDNLTNDDKIYDNANRHDAEISKVDLMKPDDDVKKNNKAASKSSVSNVRETEGRFNDAAKLNHTNVSVDDVCNDDDDALSLFAESITGFESSRKNNSVHSAPDFDEYIPQSLNQNSTKANDSVTYRPTKIKKDLSNGSREQCKSGKTICEKQNADSTSIYKECRDSNDDINRKHLEVPINNHELKRDMMSPPNLSNLNSACKKTPTQPPPLISSIYRPVYWQKTAVFTGVCFFNLAYNCSKFNCNYMHAILSAEVVKTRLRKLTDAAFTQEYMLMRSSRTLRMHYGMMYVDDCMRRNLTPLLLEMAMDFINKTNSKDDQEVKVEVVETVLLCLRTAELTTYANYLLFPIHADNALCDCFMHSIAETQNFTRFKKIFINLTNFFCEFERDINYDVATSLLVRLTILPYEEPLAKALLNVIKRTSPDILNNGMIHHLENQLLSENEALYDELQTLKDAVKQTATSNHTMRRFDDHDFDRVNMNMHTETNARCSPDTTRLDCLNKTFVTPIIKRNVKPRMGPDAAAPMVFSISNQNFDSRSNSSASKSSAGGQMTRFTRPRFQARPSFTYTNKQHVPVGNRPTIGSELLKNKFKKDM